MLGRVVEVGLKSVLEFGHVRDLLLGSGFARRVALTIRRCSDGCSVTVHNRSIRQHGDLC
jgi:hypothetical protein